MYKDEIKEIILPKIEIPKLKGRTKIELTDVNTGAKEVIEHDNDITDGLQEYCKAYGMSANTPFRVANIHDNYLWKSIIGGICLFDTALPANAKYMPAGTAMVANSYFNCSNNANPTELGSYNAVESHADYNEVAFVYDWNTAQGNGTIAAVSLLSDIGGYIGYGNSTSKTALSSKKSYIEKQGPDVLCVRMVRPQVGFPLYYKNVIYGANQWWADNGATEIEIRAVIASADKIDIFGLGVIETTTNQYKTITFTFPEALDAEYYLTAAGQYYKECLLLVPNKAIAANATFNLYLLNVETETVTKITVTNNLGKTLYNNAGLSVMLIDGQYALVTTSDNKVYKINYTNSAVIGEAELNGLITTAARYASPFNNFTEDLFLYGYSDNYIYDSVKNAFYPTNGIINKESLNTPYKAVYIKELDCLYSVWGNSSQNNYGRHMFYHHPLRLMTINNLDTPVVKTASKTMKVTYTITRAS